MAKSDDDEVMVFRGPSAREFMAEHFGGGGDDDPDEDDDEDETFEDEDGNTWSKVKAAAKKSPAKKAPAKKAGAKRGYFDRP